MIDDHATGLSEQTMLTTELDRKEAVPALVGRHEDFLIIGGLGGAAKDAVAVTNEGANLYALAGAMGAASMMGLGLALAQPSRRVLVVTGDGELLMNVGSLATIGVVNPPNLSIICVDNGRYGETGYQQSHTAHGVDLEMIARASGIRSTCTVRNAADVAVGVATVRDDSNASFVLLRVSTSPAPPVKRNLDASAVRLKFRSALLG